MSTSIGLWAKQIQGALGTAGVTVIVALQDGHVDRDEWFAIVGAVLVAFAAITFVKNATTGPLYYAKALTAGAIAVLGAFVTSLADTGWPPAPGGWAIIILAVLNAVPVSIAPNARTSDPDQFTP